jgi:hypothetical protein
VEKLPLRFGFFFLLSMQLLITDGDTPNTFEYLSIRLLMSMSEEGLFVSSVFFKSGVAAGI